jgi:hypothetical protein
MTGGRNPGRGLRTASTKGYSRSPASREAGLPIARPRHETSRNPWHIKLTAVPVSKLITTGGGDHMSGKAVFIFVMFAAFAAARCDSPRTTATDNVTTADDVRTADILFGGDGVGRYQLACYLAYGCSTLSYTATFMKNPAPVFVRAYPEGDRYTCTYSCSGPSWGSWVCPGACPATSGGCAPLATATFDVLAPKGRSPNQNCIDASALATRNCAPNDLFQCTSS